MGKTGRRDKFGPRFGRWNPLGAELGNHISHEDENDGGPIEAIIAEITNNNIEEKLNGLQSLAVLATNKDKIDSICQSEIIRIAAPLLCEKNLPGTGSPNCPIRQATAGALRNLSVTGGPEVCEFLVEKDVLTPLLTLLIEYTQNVQWTPTFDVSMRGQLDLYSDIFLQSINLLWNLCESTSLALDVINQTSLLEGLVRCLDFKVFGLDIAVSVAQFFLIISESNPKSWIVLNKHVPELLILLQNESETNYERLYLSTLSAGILTNVPALSASHASKIINTLGNVLGFDHHAILKEMLSSTSTQDRKESVPELDVGAMETVDEESEEAAALRRRRQEMPTDADLKASATGYLIDAQRLAAEVITNLCSSEDEEWADVEEEESVSETEVVCDYETETNGENDSNMKECDRLPVDVLEAIKSENLVDKLWQKTQPLSNESVYILRQNNINILMKTKNLQISALIGLQNLCNSLTKDDLGGPKGIYNVWVELGQQVFKGPQDVSILEPSTSLMRSALEHLKSNRELFDQMSQSDLELILNGVKNCSMAEIRANWLRMLGTLGCLLPEVLVKIIITFVIEYLKTEDDVWTISEALDAMMDMFADNDWPQIIVETNLIENCKDLDKVFKQKLRSQKRELKERYPAVLTVRTNFSRFIKYLENEVSKLSNGCKK